MSVKLGVPAAPERMGADAPFPISGVCGMLSRSAVPPCAGRSDTEERGPAGEITEGLSRLLLAAVLLAD